MKKLFTFFLVAVILLGGDLIWRASYQIYPVLVQLQ
jgi:hypothetical protein